MFEGNGSSVIVPPSGAVITVGAMPCAAVVAEDIGNAFTSTLATGALMEPTLSEVSTDTGI
jgi:hypothetical protein